MLLSPQERERRLRIVEKGIKDDFWKVVKESLEYLNQKDMEEVVNLHFENKPQEARDLSLVIKARQDILNDPVTIINKNKPTFDNWIVEACNACGSTIQRLKEKIKGGKENATS